MKRPHFSEIDPIPYRGPDSGEALAFRYYDKDRMVLGKRMEDHLRPAVCYWHSFCWPGSDVFGDGSFDRSWAPAGADPMQLAELKLDAAFEFFEKLGTPFFCFHDRDVAPEGPSLKECNENLDRIVDAIGLEMDRTGVQLLWGTANLFGHPRYAAGAATNPDPEIFAYAAAQLMKALDCTKLLDGSNYVLWGGREGYETLLNTDLRREADQLGRFLNMVVEHKHKIGFAGTLLIEPKPHEPTKHQYDHDCAAVAAFLRKYGLENELKLNIEVNHATLAGHSFHHEVAYAIANDLFGSVDANRGDPQNGWDTDQFPNSSEELGLALYEIMRAGGLGTGGFNFDAKLRRQSVDATDLFHAHIGGLDTLARALLGAARMIEEGTLQSFVKLRYARWNSDLGRMVMQEGTSLSDLSNRVVSGRLEPRPHSGRQEMLENKVARVF
jgi:xylose isomerase